MRRKMKNNGSSASIREVYNIAQRLEGKIDNVDNRLSQMEGRIFATTGIVAFVISLFVGIIGFFIKK